jgi:DNA-binding transcriptional regulator YhcF (GntR family)
MRKHNGGVLEEALSLGNSKDGIFHEESTLRDRIGHNMRQFILLFTLDLRKSTKRALLRGHWYSLSDLCGDARETLNSVQRRRAFRILERQGFLKHRVEMVNGTKRMIFRLTEKGIALQERFTDEAKIERLLSEAPKSSTKDSQMHAISWDIPEALRKKRALFRYFVRSVGYRLLHKSFFVGNINATDLFIKAAQVLQIDKYIHCGVFRHTIYEGSAL